MSSGEEPHQPGPQPRSKKRRTPRACDFCRKRKIRCDSEEMPDNRCSNCIEFGIECTHDDLAKKRNTTRKYITDLENRLAAMTQLLQDLRADGDTTTTTQSADTPGSSSGPPLFPPPIPLPALADTAENTAPTTEELEFEALTDRMSNLPFCAFKERFFGQASTFALLQTALDQKKELAGSRRQPNLTPKRPEFWSLYPWQSPNVKQKPPQYEFPDGDLITTLSAYYFTEYNMYLPLLHRPTFERQVAEGLHTRDSMFGATLLLVCALGAHFSTDPRVFLDGVESLHSAGWKWYRQVQLLQDKSFIYAPSLYELQAYSLTVLWLKLSPTPQLHWPLLGMGIRLALDVGAHRRKSFSKKWTVEDELKKRAFWVLICHDRVSSAFIGRPRAVQEEDFDLDFPIECDDEYWENPDPDLAFKQPAGKPSTVAYFNSFLQLGTIMGNVLRTIYSIKKSKILQGILGPGWDQQIVAELDSSLNKWVDSVPDHLRWDPHRANVLFFNQSAALYAYYYYVQMSIHRPFISTRSKPSPLTFPSLAICTNAARTCSHVADIQHRRGLLPQPHVQMAVFAAGIVLLLKVWGGSRHGLSTDADKEMADVHKCMRVLKSLEDRFYTAGRFWDMLNELAYVGELPLPQPNTLIRNKRGRDDDNNTDPIFTIPLLHQKIVLPVDEGIPASSSNNNSPRPFPSTTPQLTYTLPMYTNELGQLPLNDRFNFSSPGNNYASTGSESAFDFDAGNLASSLATGDFSLFGDSRMAEPRGFQSLQNQGPEQPLFPFNPNSNPLLDDDSLWSSAPSTFGLSDWGMYLSSMNAYR